MSWDLVNREWTSASVSFRACKTKLKIKPCGQMDYRGNAESEFKLQSCSVSKQNQRQIVEKKSFKYFIVIFFFDPWKCRILLINCQAFLDFLFFFLFLISYSILLWLGDILWKKSINHLNPWKIVLWSSVYLAWKIILVLLKGSVCCLGAHHSTQKIR